MCFGVLLLENRKWWGKEDKEIKFIEKQKFISFPRNAKINEFLLKTQEKEKIEGKVKPKRIIEKMLKNSK